MRTVLAAFLLCALSARGQDAYQRGKALYAEGDYQRAVEPDLSTGSVDRDLRRVKVAAAGTVHDGTAPAGDFSVTAKVETLASAHTVDDEWAYFGRCSLTAEATMRGASSSTACASSTDTPR